MNEKPSILNNGEENEMEVYGYKTIKWRKALCILGYIFSVGFLYHLFYWKPQWDVWCHCVLCSLEEANVILLRTTDEFKTYSKKKVMWIQVKLLQDMPHIEIISTETPDLSKLTTGTMYKVRCIKVKKTQYIWNPADGMFQKFGVLGDKYSCSDIHNLFGSGLSREEQETRRKLCGPNTIDVEIMPIWKLLYKEILNPLFFFEAYTLSTWLATGYIEYSMAIIILTLLSIVASIYICRMQSVKLHHMVESHNNILVSVLHKNGVTEEVESKYLVPGDVIILTGKKFSLPCDAILISGGCILNEGMLTGESIPVTKVPLPYMDNVIPWKMHTGDNYRGHVLFCGTEVIKTKPQADGLVKAVVLQTGFNTAKGDLVRSILYPKPLNFKLHRDAFRIIMGLVALSVIGVIYTAVIYMLSGATAGEVVLMCLIMATAAVPTSLPAALSISTFYAQARLKKQGIFCISPQRINLCGQLNLICFDKTGTLTEDGLDLWGVIPSAGKCFQEVHHFNSGYTLSWSPLLGVMASCHSLVVLDETIHGDPLDLKMFEGSGWELNNRTVDWETNEIIGSCTVVNPGSTSMVPVKGICIMHQFPFSSSLQRMSVITQVLGEDTFTLYLKGAPEMVNQFCDKETVPSNFSNILDYYTQQGFRVIGLAYKNLALNDKAKIEKITREEVESDLIFLGFLIMENRLKCETKSVIQELNSANIRTVMITGDNLQTACTVGINSGIVPDAKHLVLVEANEHERDGPGSITWQFMEENIETGNNYQVPVSSSTKMLLSHNIRVNKYHYAMSGKSYQVIKKYFPRLASDMLFHGTIFARMTPKQKSSIVEDFQKLDYYVGMCGDGANDCGALKMAHAGISLSILEASVASPFTSNIPNIECVPKLLKEGRNTFVTSVSLFKYLTMYTLIGFICILLLYWKQTILGNYQYLLQDMAITITVTLTMSLNGPAPKLAPYRHSGQLFSPPLLLSLVLHFIFTIILQTSTFVLVQQQLWYNESDIFSACVRQNQGIINQTINSVPTESQNFLTTTLWHVTGINLIIVEFIFSKGRPFRQPIYTNRVFSVLIILQLGTYVFILYADIEAIYSCMELVCTPYKWRILLFLILFLFFIVSYSVEEYVIDNRRFWLVIKKMFNYKSKSRYKELQRMLEKDEDCLLFKRLDYARQYFPDLETEICA